MAGCKEALKMRSMVTEDLPDVIKIENTCFAAPWTRGMFEQTMESASTNCFIIEEKKKVLGYIVFYIAAFEMHIMNIAVRSDCRRHGLAQSVMSAVLDYARESLVTECFLEVRENNKPAKGLYEKLGFDVVGRRRGYYNEDGEDALVMKISL